MSLPTTGAAVRRLLAVVACLMAATVLAQDLPEITETVEVRLVNVDVVVTDAQGRPVRGLEPQEFELRVDGQVVAPEYFSEVVEGRAADSASQTESRAALPYLAIVYDGSGIRPAGVRRAVDGLIADLDRLLANTRSIMVVGQGDSLVVEQPMTRNIDLLTAALERLAKHRAAPFGIGDRRQLLLQLGASSLPHVLRETRSELLSPTDDELAIAQAKGLLRQIRIQAEIERRNAQQAGQQLRLLARSMAGLQGRKAILLLGQGVQRRPAEALYRLWWDRFHRFAGHVGFVNVDAEISHFRSDNLLDQLIDEANAYRVAFYCHDPSGMSLLSGSVESGSADPNQRLARERDGMRDSLVDLSVATGGIGRVRAADVGTLVDEMVSGFASYYSLGFTPRQAERGKVQVRVRHPDLQVRYLKHFVARTTAQQLVEATLATLLTEAERNELQIGVELGKAEPQKDGTYLVPLLIKVPMARLTLLPQRSHHAGRLTFVVIAQAADGGLSEPATGAVPIKIDNAELLSVMGQVAGYRLHLRTRAGEHVVAIGVRDEVAREDATLRLVMTPDRGS